MANDRKLNEAQRSVAELCEQVDELKAGSTTVNSRITEMEQKLKQRETQLQLCHYISYFEDAFVLPQVNLVTSNNYNIMLEFYNATWRINMYGDVRSKAWKSIGMQPNTFTDFHLETLFQYHGVCTHPCEGFDKIHDKRHAHAHVITHLAVYGRRQRASRCIEGRGYYHEIFRLICNI